MGEARIWYQVCVYVAFVAVAVAVYARGRVVETFCPGPIRYYEDLGCTPVFRNEQARCPSRYNCDHMKKRSRDRCYINGHEYFFNQIIMREDANLCEDVCYCEQRSSNDEIAAFECDMTNSCPKVPVGHGCYLRRDMLTCCGNAKEICPENLNDRPFCMVNNIKYLDGETFHAPKKPWVTCICQPGYEGKNVPPFCIKSRRTTQRSVHPAFNHEDYFGKKCAPYLVTDELFTKFDRKLYSSMRCQGSGDEVIVGIDNLELDEYYDEKYVCRLGNLRMRLGEGVDIKNHTIVSCYTECICEVPPVPTCETNTDYRDCDEIFDAIVYP